MFSDNIQEQHSQFNAAIHGQNWKPRQEHRGRKRLGIEGDNKENSDTLPLDGSHLTKMTFHS